MKIYRFAAATVLVLGLAGCTSGCTNLSAAFSALTGSVATVAPATTATAEQGLTVAHLALNTVAVDILAATKAGVLHGPTATTVKTYYDTADDALKAADQLDVVANATGVMDKVNAADALIAQIHTLVPSAP